MAIDDLPQIQSPTPITPSDPVAPDTASATLIDSYGNAIGSVTVLEADSDLLAALVALHAWVPIPPTTIQLVTGSIASAADFGNQLIFQFAAQNVLLGITQAGKTIPVALYLQTLGYYLRSGSLYAAITEMGNLIADTSDDKAALSPYITNNVLYSYLNEIQTYLNIPLTQNPGS